MFLGRATEGLALVRLVSGHASKRFRDPRVEISRPPSKLSTSDRFPDALLGSGDHVGAEKVLDTFRTKDGFGYLVRRAALLKYRGETGEALHEVEKACTILEAGALPVTTRAWCRLRQGTLQLAPVATRRWVQG